MQESEMERERAKLFDFISQYYFIEIADRYIIVNASPAKLESLKGI